MDRPGQQQNSHPTPEQLEAYALGRLPEAQIAPVEEHLLICPECLTAVEAEDEYVLAMRVALRDPLPEPRPRRRWAIPGLTRPALQGLARPAMPGLLWAGAAAAMVIALVAIPWHGPEQTVPAAVTLSSFRGGEPVTMAHAPAGAPLELGIESAEATQNCRIEIVNAAGEPAWDGGLTSSDEGKLLAHVDRKLSAGQYWVRLYGPDSQLLQEFGLRVD